MAESGAAGSDADVLLERATRVKKPSLYKVIMHNDHYTTMEFVLDVLQSIFRKEYGEAYKIMMDVHRKEAGLCGVFTRQIAETKISLVHRKARDQGFPLYCSMEKE